MAGPHASVSSDGIEAAPGAMPAGSSGPFPGECARAPSGARKNDLRLRCPGTRAGEGSARASRHARLGDAQTHDNVGSFHEHGTLSPLRMAGRIFATDSSSAAGRSSEPLPNLRRSLVRIAFPEPLVGRK